MGSDISIDLSLKNIWRSWWEYKQGKKKTRAFYEFQEKLEHNLFQLFRDLNHGTYRHGVSRTFVVTDNKRREISVAPVKDRVVHRLVYDYLKKIYDKTFIYDVWSCRIGKGLPGAINRTQGFLKKYPRSFIWRADVKKFFDSVDQEILLNILSLRIRDTKALNLLREIMGSSTNLDKISGGGGVVCLLEI